MSFKLTLKCFGLEIIVNCIVYNLTIQQAASKVYEDQIHQLDSGSQINHKN